MQALASDLRLALDPVQFAIHVGLTTPDPWQEAALRWYGQRALWNCCRQSGKSTIAAILALHRAYYYPSSLVLLISASLRQSSELFRKVGERMHALPERIDLPEDNRLSCTLGNGSRIISLPSTEQTVRGFSAVDLLIFDESSRVDDAMSFATRPMLAVSGGRLIAMSTPFGRRGWWFEAWENGGDSWERVEVPATEVPRITPEFLAEECAALGDYWFQQEYFCKFVETNDQVFGYEQILAALSDEKPFFEDESHELYFGT
jgi:hypothetical protein